MNRKYFLGSLAVVILILFLLLMPKLNDMSNANYELSGMPTSISSIGNVKIGYGTFLIKNPGDEPLELELQEVLLKQGKDEARLADAKLFDRNKGKMIAKTLKVEPQSEVTFLVSFPERDSEPGPISVEITVLINGHSAHASSPISVERRIPE